MGTKAKVGSFFRYQGSINDTNLRKLMQIVNVQDEETRNELYEIEYTNFTRQNELYSNYKFSKTFHQWTAD